MKIVGISQRVIVNNAYPERRDALAQGWYNFLATVGLIAFPLPNHKATVSALLQQVTVTGFILSGGNDLVPYGGDAPERDEVEALILEGSKKTMLPVLGICRGLQFMNVHEGGTLQKIDYHAANRHQLDDGRTVNSYHNYALSDVASGFEVLQRSRDDFTVEAVKHQRYNWQGIMWHPEREVVPDEMDIKLFQEMFL